jgi:hypothetical protein
MTHHWKARTVLLVFMAALPAAAQQAPAASPTASAINGHLEKKPAPAPAGSAAPKTPAPAADDSADDDSGSTQDLPPGHPSIAPGTQATKGSGFQPPPDIAQPDAQVPIDTIKVQILDKDGHPVPNTKVKLGILQQSIAEGESHAARSGTTDREGHIQFDGLEAASGISYRVSVPEGRATYATDPFVLKKTMGQRVVLHVYPSTDDIRAAMVGMRGFGYIQPRDDAYQLEFMFQIYNIGPITWVPKDVHIDLPHGWKAFVADKSMSDTRVVADGDSGIKLEGTFSPGQHQIGFRFQVPNDHDATTSFSMGMPPHMASMQMVVESAPGMSMNIAGFGPAQPATNNNGQRVLVAARQLQQGEPQMNQLSITLAGVPTPPAGRWYAVVIAFSLGLVGLGIALGRSKNETKRAAAVAQRDIEQSRQLLLDELVALEHAKRREQIGPRTYERTRRTLLDALARLEAMTMRGSDKASKRKPGGTRHSGRAAVER